MVYLYTTVDRIHTDELVDLVIDREIALQEQGVPLHVVPLRTPEREAQVRTQVAEERKHFSLQEAFQLPYPVSETSVFDMLLVACLLTS